MPTMASASRTKALVACLTFASASLSLSYVIKAIVGVYAFHAPCFMLSMQMVVALTVIGVMKAFPKHAPMELPPLKQDILIESLPQTYFYVVNVLLSFMSMAIVNVPLFLCLRRTSLLFVLVAEFYVLHKVPSRLTQISVLLMTVGAIMASWDSINDVLTEASILAVVMVTIQNIHSAGFLTVLKRFSNKHEDIKSFGLVMYQSIGALPVLVIVGLMTGEWNVVASFTGWSDPMFIVWISLASCLGMVLTYTMMRLNKLTSPVALTVTGCTKDMASTVASAFIFAGFNPTPMIVSGLALSFIASVIYGVDKLRAKQQQQAQAKPPTPNADAHSSVELARLVANDEEAARAS